jgi:AcrR family transcriptional regulator
MATTNTVNARAVGTAKPSARERLLAAADELFYAEGVRTVGIDRVIEQAGVAKASLYNTFGSKEALIHAYLEGRHAKTAARIARYIERYEAPRERLLAVFESQAEQFADPGFRGCAFAAASAEAHSGDQVEQASAVYRGWIRQLFTELAEQAAVADAAGLARQLQLIYDGSGLSARMDHDPEVSRISRDTAAILLDAAPKAER